LGRIADVTTTLAAAFPYLGFANVLVWSCVGLAVVLGVLAFLDRSTPAWALALILVLELALVVLGVLAVIAWIGGSPPAEPVVFFFYLLVVLLAPPVMVWWGRGEPGRWGSGAVAVALLLLAVLIVRVEQVWAGGI
jgi:hypothetical protein